MTNGTRTQSWLIKRNETWRKWPMFARRYYQIHFHEWLCLNLDLLFLTCSLYSNWQYNDIGNVMASCRQATSHHLDQCWWYCRYHFKCISWVRICLFWLKNCITEFYFERSNWQQVRIGFGCLLNRYQTVTWINVGLAHYWAYVTANTNKLDISVVRVHALD